MKKIIIFGNSASGKSTLSKAICRDNELAHLDLDTVAWKKTSPVMREELSRSQEQIDRFASHGSGWVIEGCYTDLLELIVKDATEVIFLDIPIETCVENAKSRPWEEHKYESKEAQDKNLDMLIEWINEYDKREDNLSRKSHIKLFETCDNKKTRLKSTEEVQKYLNEISS